MTPSIDVSIDIASVFCCLGLQDIDFLPPSQTSTQGSEMKSINDSPWTIQSVISLPDMVRPTTRKIVVIPSIVDKQGTKIITLHKKLPMYGENII